MSALTIVQDLKLTKPLTADRISEIVRCAEEMRLVRGGNALRWVVFSSKKQAELAELVDALDSGSSVRKDFRVRVPDSALGRDR